MTIKLSLCIDAGLTTNNINHKKLYQPMKPVNLNYNLFIEEVLKANPQANVKLIKKAFDFAKKCHEGQERESGEDYFTHPLQTAMILIGLNADSATIAAALLHDCVEDSDISINKVEKDFDEQKVFVSKDGSYALALCKK